MIDGKNAFDHMPKFEIGHGDDYTTGCLLDYNYFNESLKMMAIDLNKQGALDADPKTIQQINFTGKLAQFYRKTS